MSSVVPCLRGTTTIITTIMEEGVDGMTEIGPPIHATIIIDSKITAAMAITITADIATVVCVMIVAEILLAEKII